MERWVHVDLKSMAPTTEALSEHLRAWARAGANGILFEWENMFPYPGLAGAVRPDAYTEEEVRAIVGLCGRLGMKAVPLVQTMGHLEWLLAGPAFAHLREFPDRPSLLRACDPEGLQLLSGKINALLSVHGDSPYVHLGGDEARGLDRINRPGCSSVREGPAAVYLRHMRPLLTQVIEAGKRPILWADMPLRYPGELDAFPRETIFCDWRYNATCDHAEEVTEWAFNTVNGDSLLRIPAARRALFERYWSIDAPDYPRRFYQFPYTPFLRDRGFDVLGASASMYALMPLAGPRLPEARANARHWIRAVRRFGGLGVVNTCWAVRGAFRETALSADRAFLRMAAAAGGEEPDADVSRAAWEPVGGDQADLVAAALDALVLPLDPLSRTHPHAIDPVSGMNRAVPYDERWESLVAELAVLDPAAPAVREHEDAVIRSRAAQAALAPLPDSPELTAVRLSVREAGLRAGVWLSAWRAARNGSRPGWGEAHRAEIERQAAEVRHFMQGRYLASDVDRVSEDRYEGLLRLVRKQERSDG